MGHEEAVSLQPERRTTDDPTRRASRYRLVPPAITPVRMRDLAAGLVAHARGTGLEAFRADVAEFIDAGATATFTSYRRALGVCLRELGERADGADTVLIPAFSSADFRQAIEGVGLSVKRYDVNPATLALDQASLGEHLDGDALAVVAVNVLGYGSPMDAVADLCADRGIALVETLGYAIGSSYRGEQLGTFGDCAVLNFQQGKPIPIGGGMVASRTRRVDVSDADRSPVTPNLASLVGYATFAHPRLYYAYSRAESLADQVGFDADRVTTHPGSKHGVAYEPPFATMSNFQGAVGRRIFERLDDHRRHRARTARYYDDHLADCDRVDLVRAIDGLEDHQHVRYPIVVDSPALRREIRESLAAAGIQARRLYDWPKIDERRYPGAARLQGGILTLPTHPYVADDDRRTVVETIRSVASSA